MFGHRRTGTSDVGLSLVEDSLPPPVGIPASWNTEWSVGVRYGQEVVPLNPKINTSLTQRVFQVLDIIRLVLIGGGRRLRVRSSCCNRSRRGSQVRWWLGV